MVTGQGLASPKHETECFMRVTPPKNEMSRQIWLPRERCASSQKRPSDNSYIARMPPGVPAGSAMSLFAHRKCRNTGRVEQQTPDLVVVPVRYDEEPTVAALNAHVYGDPIGDMKMFEAGVMPSKVNYNSCSVANTGDIPSDVDYTTCSFDHIVPCEVAYATCSHEEMLGEEEGPEDGLVWRGMDMKSINQLSDDFEKYLSLPEEAPVAND